MSIQLSAVQDELNRAQKRKERLQKFNYRFRNNSVIEIAESESEYKNDVLNNLAVKCLMDEIVREKKFSDNKSFNKLTQDLILNISEVLAISYSINNEVLYSIYFRGYCKIYVNNQSVNSYLRIEVFKRKSFFPDYLKTLLKIYDTENYDIESCTFICKKTSDFNYAFDVINYSINGGDGFEEIPFFISSK